ncbi:uncharacterized protein LOC111073945 [Drosophila obscura]|uniref:uncharacterized protein LOC111073945 n=1 Tax=Drosophila obscura TaxID=7282 RepID=UPI000B9FA0A6|nr:uncharacterized protein LOC111073945 [Drosophila obscura]XP_022222205.1 uncharacterized protein LOC111073945 [Drosophila obscura]XP_022222206.1 uncharacterized protein LOC111073945 [Drosophila obscura]
MSRLPTGLARLLSPGLVLNNELSQKIAAFEAMNIQRAELDRDISLLRKQQDDTEDRLAEDLAEEEFQNYLRGRQVMEHSYIIIKNICNQRLGCIVEKLAVKYRRILYLDTDIRKIKQSIESGIIAANEELTVAASM